MTFATLAVMTALCLLIPVALPVSAVSAVILLYFYPYATLTLLSMLLLGWVAFLYLKRKIRNAHN